MRPTVAHALVATALLAAGPTPSPAAGVEPDPGGSGSGFPAAGPVFATPGGNQVTNRIKRAVNGTEAPAVIRAATGLTDSSVTAALVAAHRRGVGVRMVIPGNTTRGCSSTASQDLIEVLGTDTDERSWVSCTQGSARNEPGTPGHMHMKVWAFTSTSGEKDVVLVTSQNATDNGAAVQYNDAYMGVGWQQLHDAWRTLFGELKADAGGGFWERTWKRSGAYATPLADQSRDPILRRIRDIPARGATIRAAISAISYGRGTGHRSIQIARLLVAKESNGADVAVVYTQAAGKRPPRAVRIMRSHGIRVFAFENDGDYVHNKFMTASHPTRSGRAYRVWTGSEEWKESSYGQDEFVLRLSRERTVKAYVAEWQRLRDRSRDE